MRKARAIGLMQINVKGRTSNIIYSSSFVTGIRKMKRVLTSSIRSASSWETEVAAWLMTLRSSALAISRSLWKHTFTDNTEHARSSLSGQREREWTWSHWKSTGSYRKEFGQVKLGQKKAFSLLQNVSWLATQLSLELIDSYSLAHCQKLSQHACITHQIFKLQLSSSEDNLERHNAKQLLLLSWRYNNIINAVN